MALLERHLAGPLRGPLQGELVEQLLLLDELALLTQRLERLESEMTLVEGQCREGQILTSIPCIGAVPAAAIIASIGDIAKFARSSQLKSYFGWAPTLSQSGRSAGAARLSPRDSRLMKRAMYLAAWKAIQGVGSKWKRLYEKLIPHKCRCDEPLAVASAAAKSWGALHGLLSHTHTYRTPLLSHLTNQRLGMRKGVIGGDAANCSVPAGLC
jgi:transposase